MPNMLEYLLALRQFCCDFHNGQHTRYYRIGCLCDHYLRQWYGLENPVDFLYNLRFGKVKPPAPIRLRLVDSTYAALENKLRTYIVGRTST